MPRIQHNQRAREPSARQVSSCDPARLRLHRLPDLRNRTISLFASVSCGWWCSQIGGHRFTGGHGLLSLQVLSFVVGRTRQSLRDNLNNFRTRRMLPRLVSTPSMGTERTHEPWRTRFGTDSDDPNSSKHVGLPRGEEIAFCVVPRRQQGLNPGLRADIAYRLYGGSLSRHRAPLSTPDRCPDTSPHRLPSGRRSRGRPHPSR